MSIGVLLLSLAIIALAWWAPFDPGAEETVDAGLKRAFVTYASARTLNGVISVAQGTEVTVGVGASTTLSVGEALDPINDAVEQFSDLMLLASISFGIQRMLLSIGGHEYVNAALSAVVLLAVVFGLSGRGVPDLVRSVLVLLLMARFAVPLASAGSELVYMAFLDEPYQEASTAIGAATEEISTLQGEVTEDSGKAVQSTMQSDEADSDERGFVERVWSGAKSIATSFNPFEAFRSVRAKMSDLKLKAEQIAENLVDLAVIFLLQTIVLPLLFLWGFYYLMRSAVGPRAARNLHPPGEWPGRFERAVKLGRAG